MTLPRWFSARRAVAFFAGAGLQLAVVAAASGRDDPYPASAVAFGVLIAAIAGAIGGLWVGLTVGAVGWVLHFFYVADESLAALVSLPAWLAAGAAAGWLAARLDAGARAQGRLDAELGALRASATEAIVGVDAQGDIVGWSAGGESMYGYTADEIQGQPLAVITDSPELVEAARKGERLQHVPDVHRRKDGSELRVSLSLTPLVDGADEASGAVFVASDVGERLRVAEQLGAIETRYRSLTAHLPGVTYVRSIEEPASPLFVSPQVERLLDYSVEDWLAEPQLFERLLHPDDRDRVLAELAEARDRAEPFRSEYRLLARDGRVVWVRDEAATVRDENGVALYVQGHFLDVGERRRAEAETARVRSAEEAAAADARSRQRKLDFLAAAGQLITSSSDYSITLRKVADLAVRDLADWCIIDLVDDDGAATRLATAHYEPGLPPGPHPGAEPDEETLEVVRSARPTASEARICVPLLARGRSLGAVTFITSTENRHYTNEDLVLVQALGILAALAVDDARLYEQVQERADAARVLTYVADAVFLLDRGGVVRLWNPAAEAITGLSAGAVVGKPAAQSIPAWETLAERIPVGKAQEPATAATLPVETALGERWISISGVEFFGGTVYAFRDLTEARRLEELKADFLATASHELRTPLAAVYGAAQTLRRHDFALDEAGRERFIALIVDESERLGRIVNEILLANQLELGRVDFTGDAFDAVDLVERVAEAASIHAPPGIELDVQAPEPVPSVAADRDKVRQVLMNLVENAMKYSPDGGRIELGVESVDSVARFRVLDEGLGIPTEEHARIFDKFYRLDPGMTRGVGGTGLGLYICNELVERMGGRIWVESRDSRGSAFFFEIPAGDERVERGLAPARNSSAA